MQEVIKFLKEIFMLKKEDNIKIGLTQFKAVDNTERSSKKTFIPQKTEVKLSDLMRRSY